MLDATEPTLPPSGRREAARPEHVVFTLEYDRELGFLVNEGALRPDMQPGGLKET